MEIMEVKGLMRISESWKNQFEFWKSPGNLFLKKGTNPEISVLSPHPVVLQAGILLKGLTVHDEECG